MINLVSPGDIVAPSSPPDGARFERNGSVLLVSAVDKSDFGVYVCLVTLTSEPVIRHAVRRGINVNGAYFGDLYLKYLPRVKVALYAGVTMFVVMCLLCFRMDRNQARLDRPRESRSGSNLGHQGEEPRKVAVTCNVEMVSYNPGLNEQTIYEKVGHEVEEKSRDNPAFLANESEGEEKAGKFTHF